MIDITAIEQPDRKRVVCVTVIDGKWWYSWMTKSVPCMGRLQLNSILSKGFLYLSMGLRSGLIVCVCGS